MADINWQNTLWQNGNADNTSFSIESDTNGGSLIAINDITKLFSDNAQITENQPSKDWTIYLGTGVSAKTETAPSAVGFANTSALKVGMAPEGEDARPSATTYAFGSAVIGVNGTTAYVKSLKLSDQVFGPDGSAVSIAINSSSITELTGAKGADKVVINNFGSTGTIDLGAGTDNIEFTADAIGTKKITVDGGVGNDTITANGNTLTYKLASYDTTSHTLAETDKVSGAVEKSTIQLASGRKFSELEVSSFSASGGDKLGGGFMLGLAREENTIPAITTNFSLTTDTASSNGVVLKFTGDSGERTALIYGSPTENASVAVTAAVSSTTNLYIGSKTAHSNGTADVANKAVLKFDAKTNIFLGHEESTADQFGDTSQYVNVKAVSAGKEKSLVIGNLTTSENSGDLLIASANKGAVSLCGVGGAADTLQGTAHAEGHNYFGTLANAGIDVVKNFTFGEKSSVNADVAVFADGLELSKVKSSSGNLFMGSSEKDGLSFDANGQDTGNGVYVNYQIGLDGKTTDTALIDVKGGDTLKFDTTKATTYIGGTTGQAADATTLDLQNAQVALGFDANCFEGKSAQYNSYGMASINGANTKDGSIINGAANNAETIVGASAANSFVCGGFHGNFIDEGNDTLVGSGSENYTTEFFVGTYMGSDTVANLSSKDKVTFLNTKVSDLTNLDTSGKSLVAFTKNGTITLTSVTGDTSTIKDVTIQLADAAVVWNGSTFVAANS